MRIVAGAVGSAAAMAGGAEDRAPATGAVGTPVSTRGGASAVGTSFAAASLSGGAAASSALRPAVPVIRPKKNASPSAASSPTNKPTACRAVMEIW